MSSEGYPVLYERRYTTPDYVQTVSQTWSNRREFVQPPKKEGVSPVIITYVYDGDPDGEDCRTIASLWGGQMVVFGETLAMIELNLARLDKTYEYGKALTQAAIKEPIPIAPYLMEETGLKTA
jgi:hypothetical protein